ncbi:hypothetical protein [Nocardia noduli]|uniref:hypothetical protein n=1 Tax=Nocardia noduli TaxID=2815722 RepID=UPI001C22DD47|nr:hypothetical protein [Nocardia noduli]
MDLLAWSVAQMPPWPAEVDEDNLQRIGVLPVVDWRVVADASAEAVDVRRNWTSPDWRAHGRRIGLREHDLFAWHELITDPIQIMAEGTQWQAGRHRCALISAAGALRVAVVDPNWIPDDRGW